MPQYVSAHAEARAIEPAELRALIKSAGITQLRAAELCSARLRTLQDWLYGTAAAPGSAVELLCVALVAHGYLQPDDVSRWLSPAVAALCDRGAPGAGRRGCR